MRLSLVLIFALALCAAKRHGGCRGEGSHPYGKHGRGEGKGKGKGGGHDDDKGRGQEGNVMGDNERHEHHDRHPGNPKRDFYLNTTLVEFQDKWDEQGVEGPSTADAAVLLSKCLAATDSEELKSRQCATEYQWMEECIDCDLDKWSPGAADRSTADPSRVVPVLGTAPPQGQVATDTPMHPTTNVWTACLYVHTEMLGAVSAGAGVGGVLLLCAALYCRLRLKRIRSEH